MAAGNRECCGLLLGRDTQVIELNEGAYAMLNCRKAFNVVPGATHLFEEPGTLEQVARLAKDWFIGCLPSLRAVGPG